MMTFMVEGRFIFEISPNQILLLEGPWDASPKVSEWEIAIMPFKPLSKDSPRFLNARRSRIVGREELSQCGKGLKFPKLDFHSSAPELFHTSFQELQALIVKGSAQKGVPWGFQTAQLPEATSYWADALKNATKIGSELVLYGAEMAHESVLGATPEWLFKIESGGRKLRTMALAGTRWTNQQRTPEQEKKDALEHALVVENIRDNLRPFGEVKVGTTTWVKAGSVEHLKTAIELIADNELDANEMLRVLHPTPAVGVFPRTPEALKWLHGLPGHETRADFAAPWVVRNTVDGRAWALVALRQIRMRLNEIFIPAGCGVVAGSNVEVEWREIQEKILSVKKCWGLAE